VPTMHPRGLIVIEPDPILRESTKNIVQAQNPILPVSLTERINKNNCCYYYSVPMKWRTMSHELGVRCH
jgi:hypothetical protein